MIAEGEKAIGQLTDLAGHLHGVTTLADVHHPETALAPVQTPGYRPIEDTDDLGVARLANIDAVREPLRSKAEAMDLDLTVEDGPLHDDSRLAERIRFDPHHHLGDLVLPTVRPDRAMPLKVVAARSECGRRHLEVKFPE